MKELNRKRMIVTVLAVFMIMVLIPVRNVYAASTASKAKAAYAKMVKKTIKITTTGAYPGASTQSYSVRKGKYALIYLNKDSIPELVVAGSGGMDPWAVFTYKNGKVKQVISGALITDFDGYYKKTGVMRLRQHQEFIVYFYRKMSGTKWVTAAKKDAKGRKLTKPSWKKLKMN